jgi:hypothetical protein
MLMIPDFFIVLVVGQRVKLNDGCPDMVVFAYFDLGKITGSVLGTFAGDYCRVKGYDISGYVLAGMRGFPGDEAK